MTAREDGGIGVRGLGLIRQTAYVVEDIEESARGGKPYIEFVDPAGAMVALFERVAQGAKDWDGSEPIRLV